MPIPTKLDKFPFGKYAGVSYGDVPADYLLHISREQWWVSVHAECANDVVAYLREHAEEITKAANQTSSPRLLEETEIEDYTQTTPIQD